MKQGKKNRGYYKAVDGDRRRRFCIHLVCRCLLVNGGFVFKIRFVRRLSLGLDIPLDRTYMLFYVWGHVAKH